MTGPLLQSTPVEVIAETYEVGIAPVSGGDGVVCTAKSGIIRTYVTYDGSVTAAALRLYTRVKGGEWFRGASTADIDALAPASGNESRDWFVGDGVEAYFVLESVSPGTSGNTVQVNAVGVMSA